MDSPDDSDHYLRYGDRLFPLRLQYRPQGVRPRLYHHYDVDSIDLDYLCLPLLAVQSAALVADEGGRLSSVGDDNGSNRRYRCLFVDTLCLPEVQATSHTVYDTKAHNRAYQYRTQSVFPCPLPQAAADMPFAYRLVLRSGGEYQIYRHFQLLFVVHSAAFADTRYFRGEMAFQRSFAPQDASLLPASAYAWYCRHNESDDRQNHIPLHISGYARRGTRADRCLSGLLQGSDGDDDVYLRFPLRLRAVYFC